MYTNPIIDEVRKAGKKLSEECNNDINKFAEYIKKREEKIKKKGWKVVTKSDFVKV